MSKPAPNAEELLARWNAAAKVASGSRTYADLARLTVAMADILGDLIIIVAQHTREPFTKAHDKDNAP